MATTTTGSISLVTSHKSISVQWGFRYFSSVFHDVQSRKSPSYELENKYWHLEIDDYIHNGEEGCRLQIFDDNAGLFSSLKNKGKFLISKVKMETNSEVQTFQEYIDNSMFFLPYTESTNEFTFSTISVKFIHSCHRVLKGYHGLCHKMKESYLKKLHCDFIIKVKNQEFQVHKFVLAAQSPVFKAMMEHNMFACKDSYIHMTDCDPQAFHVFLLYMYSGETDSLSHQNINDVYMVADKYDVDDLKEECARFLKENINMYTVCNVLEMAKKYKNSNLLKASREFFKKNRKSIEDRGDNFQKPYNLRNLTPKTSSM